MLVIELTKHTVQKFELKQCSLRCYILLAVLQADHLSVLEGCSFLSPLSKNRQMHVLTTGIYNWQNKTTAQRIYTLVRRSHLQFLYPPLLCSEGPDSLYSSNVMKKETSLCLCPHLLQRGEEISGGWSSLWVVGQTLPHHTNQTVLSSTHQIKLLLQV